ncbi:ATP-dependent zinc metalloprotease FtsH [Chroococcus sp. FPU101]|uniref:ATP-dependent zinc metalloprotease FtsH n=1 Tax=Chroococcus sp. FPU101 TaxID=1974212 RepID=UPI001A8D47B1|nr:ATP-dependent zinc metalloprotease FtsH [Chroococcus sp. FPU101]GFE69238.1 ATP-dependent metalloprotease FtsH [Chroococcus sp. FPU101]
MGMKDKFQFPRVGNLLLVLAGASFLAYLFFPRSNNIPERTLTPYSEFLTRVNNGEVSQVKLANQLILYQLKSPLEGLKAPEGFNIPDSPVSVPQNSQNPFHTAPEADQNQYPLRQQGTILATIPINDPNLATTLQAKGVTFEAAPPPQNAWFSTLLAWVVPPLILVAAMQYFLHDDSRRSLAFNKNLAKVYDGESTRITFSDIAGAEEAKTELKEIVEFLKEPDRFNRIGAKIPKGILLVGPPGTGKTLLAKAVAGEAEVTFFSISASEFVELFVGTGAARVRDLFKQAKEQAPCIIFIDELDAIGKSRSSSNVASGSSDEREQTLNQLLTEMDGFDAKESVIIILGATNRPETLDRALLRPGRFDRQVLVDRPDLAGRLAILEIYAQKVQIEEDVDLKVIATQTPGFAGADLANLVNEAALLAARNHREKVSQADLKEAIERVIAGLERKSRVLSDKEKKIVAYHEVGHALVGAIMSDGKKVEKITIVPRGSSALGYALYTPTEDRFLSSEKELCDRIASLLGGRAAEEIVFGSVTDGAFSDLQRATDIAEDMVTLYGMSKVLGPLAYERQPENNFLGNGGASMRRFVSEETSKVIDKEVRQLVEQGYEQAKTILTQNRELLEIIAQKLLVTEVVEGEELQMLLAKCKLS